MAINNEKKKQYADKMAGIFCNIINNQTVYVPGDGQICFRNPYIPNEYADMLAHTDVVADGMNIDRCTHSMWRFDIKDVENKNSISGKYTISNYCKEYCSQLDDNHYFAFQLTIPSSNDADIVKLNSFVCVKSSEVINLCYEDKKQGEHGYYSLYSIRDIENKCSTKFFIGDKNDLCIYKKKAVKAFYISKSNLSSFMPY